LFSLLSFRDPLFPTSSLSGYFFVSKSSQPASCHISLFTIYRHHRITCPDHEILPFYLGPRLFTLRITRTGDRQRTPDPCPSDRDTVFLMGRTKSHSSPLSLDFYDVALDSATGKIAIYGCYYIGPLDTLGGSRDTFSLGVLPVGSYQVTMFTRSKEGTAPFPAGPCESTIWDSLSISFTVDQTQTVNSPDFFPLTLYPNPASGLLRLESAETSIESLRLIDYTGRCIPAEIMIEPRRAQLTTSYKGIAILRIQTKRGVWNRQILFR
jgi:hypothetical protein